MDDSMVFDVKTLLTAVLYFIAYFTADHISLARILQFCVMNFLINHEIYE